LAYEQFVCVVCLSVTSFLLSSERVLGGEIAVLAAVATSPMAAERPMPTADMYPQMQYTGKYGHIFSVAMTMSARHDVTAASVCKCGNVSTVKRGEWATTLPTGNFSIYSLPHTLVQSAPDASLCLRFKVTDGIG
jgi:hypothetical protein